MRTRRSFLRSGAAAVAALATSAWPARAANAPGVTDAEIKIGQTMPYSGPASAYGVIGRTEAAYFRMINEQGGVNGRKIKSHQPRRRLQPAEDRGADAPAGRAGAGGVPVHTLGTPTNLAVRQYLNDNKVPQLFVAERRPVSATRKHFPWTMGLHPELPDGSAHLRQVHPDDEARREDRRALSERRLRQETISSGSRTALGPNHAEHDRQGGFLRSLRADGRLASRHSARLRRRRLPDRRDAEVRRPGDPQILRHSAGTLCVTWTSSRDLSYPYLKPAGLEKSKGVIAATFAQGCERPAMEGRSGGQGVEGFLATNI